MAILVFKYVLLSNRKRINLHNYIDSVSIIIIVQRLYRLFLFGYFMPLYRALKHPIEFSFICHIGNFRLHYKNFLLYRALAEYQEKDLEETLMKRVSNFSHLLRSIRPYCKGIQKYHSILI